jgi:hypothetical protein
MRCIVVEKLVGETDFIIPIENAIITEIWTNPAMCVRTSGTINCLHSELNCSGRSVYNISTGSHSVCLCIVIAITTRAACGAVKWKYFR